MANLSVSELIRFDWRIKNFLKKYRSEEKFELSNGQKVNLLFDEKIYDALQSKRYEAISKIVFVDRRYKTKTYRLSSFKKTEEFGGIPERKTNLTDAEIEEMQSINKQIGAIRSKTGEPYITLRLNDKNIRVVRCVKTPGNPKSDLHMIDENGNEVVWISHKKGYLPSEFQQWGGITEEETSNHPEVRSFIEDIKEKYPDGIPRATNIGRMINDDILKKKAVYGSNYTGKKQAQLDRNNVSVVLQGKVRLVKDGSAWKLKGYNTYENGNSLSVSYEPILICFYRGDRSNFGIKGARFAFFPKIGKRIDVWI